MHKLTRRHVMLTMTGSTLMLCPAILNAQTVSPEWDGLPDTTPVGEDQLINVGEGPAEVDITDLEPGQVTVIARPTTDEAYSATGQIQYVAVHYRTEAQIAFGAENDRDGTVQDPRYFVVNLVCTHRGKAIGMTGDPAAPFACLDRGDRHSSVFDASGFGIAGASEDEYLSIPDYSLTTDGDQVVLQLA
ncbi:hypothetical protein [Yoonia sp. BS5-3]|uniref:Rieske domain-containing protein n=1 Tax=Yoonia phaeophyticola TaxID=3137369 RepID=A0ABZ2V7V1_9RHOB